MHDKTIPDESTIALDKRAKMFDKTRNWNHHDRWDEFDWTWRIIAAKCPIRMTECWNRITRKCTKCILFFHRTKWIVGLMNLRWENLLYVLCCVLVCGCEYICENLICAWCKWGISYHRNLYAVSRFNFCASTENIEEVMMIANLT